MLLAEMVFAIEPLRDVWDNVVEMAQKHWNETQQHRHDQPFSPSFERYAQVEAVGGYVQFTARVEGRMVGYAGIYIVPSMHTQSLICVEDTWYLKPEYRKGFNAVKFFRFMEDYCRSRGVHEVTLTAPIHTRAEVIHRYLGYKAVATQSSKCLKPVEI